MIAMTPFVQVAIAVVTIAIVVVAIGLVRALGRFTKAVDVVTDPNGAVAKLVDDAARTSTEVRELVAKLEAVSESVGGLAERFQNLSDRVLTMSSAFLDEVEPPVQRAVSVVRGVSAAAEILIERWGRPQQQQVTPERVEP